MKIKKQETEIRNEFIEEYKLWTNSFNKTTIPEQQQVFIKMDMILLG